MRVQKVRVFVDWNSQIHAAPVPTDTDETSKAERTLAFVVRKVEASLNAMNATCRYNVALRIYHGWRKGFEATLRRKAIVRATQFADLDGMLRTHNVSIMQTIELGDDLAFASDDRRHSRLGCHLPNTLRNSITQPNLEEEKLVDTAIASDVVAFATREPSELLIVVGEDDDLVAPILTAEYLRSPIDAPVRLLRNRRSKPFYILDGLEC
tara:strand:- start:3044 stop:3673 length:630 start_codon:yes stop_codon:yes gene_type:complete